MGQKINKSMVSRAIVSKIQDERNSKEIRTNHIVGYKSPLDISFNESDETFVPDIEAIYENETVIYEIELNKKISLNKWRSFSNYARNRNGSFYLVVPDYLKDLVRKKLEDKHMNAGVITFATE